jgi:N-acylneuraminate cytidylyltransferase
MKMKALVPVRSGSVRVKNKNIRPFADTNLLELKLRQLKRPSSLDGIVVNSNDDAMLKIASSLGCQTVKRAEEFASNTVSMSDVYVNIAENFRETLLYFVMSRIL